MSILEHTWGESRYVDRVWSQVVGLRPAFAGSRQLMTLRAYLDESGDETFLVVGGYLGSTEDWVKFTVEWEKMLPYGTRGKNGFEFHMVEMAKNPERMARVPAFFRIIESVFLIGLGVIIDLKAWRRACDRLYISHPGGMFLSVEGDMVENPWLIAQNYIHLLIKGIKPKDKVEVIFDNRSEKDKILRAWADAEARGDVDQAIFGSHPKFEDDNEFLPLQAADLLSWWVRKWAHLGLDDPKFGHFDWPAHMTRASFLKDPSEDLMTDFLLTTIEQRDPGLRVVDLATVVTLQRD